ncbi:ABC transporter ATP-binding protein [Bacillus pseudomycoides]|uniref:ABC transporter ATP-binding protein n=1 Tax=Bacillus pseudomycoides TaxID=64104 RepID=UPI000BF37901|nr:ABC transporter ATP-binding protein [Bacillus pseudomycoides]PGD73694.1 ABC transporter ATP-binding protein [Bacillus pseudomycoides]
MHKITTLLHYIRNIKTMYLFSILLLFFESIAFIATIALQKKLIDDVFIPNEFQYLTQTLFLFLLSFLSYVILFTLTPHIFNKNAAKLREVLVEKILTHLNKITITRIENERSGKFVNYLTQDVEAIAWTIANNIPRGLQQLVNIVILAFFIGSASISILLCISFFSIFYFMLSKYFASKIKEANKCVQNEKSNLLIHIEESISSTREVIAFHRLDWEKQKYDTIFQKYFSSLLKEGKLISKQLISSEPIKWGVNLICLSYGGFLVLQGDLSLGLFIIAFQFTAQLMDSFHRFFLIVMDISKRFAHFERIQEPLQYEIVEDGEDSLKKDLIQISFNHVMYTYPKQNKYILNDIILDIPLNKKVAFVGNSGCGKSTIIKLLLRFIDPTSGEILINGVPLKRIKKEYWTDRIGIVNQEPYLFPDTVRNNILFGREYITDDIMIEVCKKAQIHNFIMNLPNGYDTIIGDRGINLSGGERQRLAIARAILENPEILILDEATSALDLETERRIQKNIDEIRKGKTTIIIAHRMSTIKNADTIFVVNEGKIKQFGTHKELLEKSPIYCELVNNQMIEGA